MVTLDAAQPVSPAFTEAVGSTMHRFLADRRRDLAAIGPELTPLLDRATTFTAGGKRLRPSFCAWGYAAAAQSVELPYPVVAAAASLDLLHVSALVHDDVMDASDSRRGVPSAHRQFELDHRDASARGDAAAFGRAAAILLGDLLLVWSDELFSSCGLDAGTIESARPWLADMRTEVTAGQYLDVLAQSADPYAGTRTAAGVAELEALVARVVTYKSACYTVERPLHVGAALGGGHSGLRAAFSAFGRPLGRAFQYRDDLLGVFGDESLTGKQSGEDLREGKLTLLVVKTFAQARPADAREFATLLGAPDLDTAGVERAREIITDSGAAADVERAISAEHTTALAALAATPGLGASAEALVNLADAAVRRAF